MPDSIIKTRSQMNYATKTSIATTPTPLAITTPTSTASTIRFSPGKTTQSSITQEYFMMQIKSLKDHFNKSLALQKEELIKQLKSENSILRGEIEELKEELKEKSKQITVLENDVVDVQQYIRRNNVEICGIPDNVSDNDLEKKVIELASVIDVKINKHDIEACHRLKARRNTNGPKRTIVRFTNRKWCDKLHANKKKIKEDKERKISVKLKSLGLDHKKVYINNNLCPSNKFLWGKCKRLHDAKLIDRFWIYNGFVYIADDITDARGTKISHLNVLKHKYPGFDFDSYY